METGGGFSITVPAIWEMMVSIASTSPAGLLKPRWKPMATHHWDDFRPFPRTVANVISMISRSGPDNLMITYDYGAGRLMTYEMRIWTPYPLEGENEGGAVYGDQGYIVIGNQNWRAYTMGDELVKESQRSYMGNTHPHVEDFIQCMRTREKPRADLETVGHPSSLMCHLGNAAWRAGRTIRMDPQTYTCIGDKEANSHLSRETYHSPWILPSLAQI